MIFPIRADARVYTIIAYNLARKGIYSIQTGSDVKPDPGDRDPGYPFFLSIIAKKADSLTGFFYSAGLAQSVIGAFTVVLTFFLARFFLSHSLSLIVCLLAMISPHLISMTNYVLTETLFTFVLVTGILVFLQALNDNKMSSFALAGILLGLGILIRSVLLLFPFILGALLFCYYRKEQKTAIKVIGIFFLASFSLVFCWKLWSWSVVKPSESSGSLLQETLYVGSYKNLVYDGIPPSQRRGGVGMPYVDDPRYEEVIQGGYQSIIKEIIHRFKMDPLGYSLWWLSGKPGMFWQWHMVHAGGDINIYPLSYTWYDRNRIMGVLKKTMQVSHPFIIILMHIGVIYFILKRKKYSKKHSYEMLIILFLLLYFFAIHVILVPVPRYAIPLRPYMYLMAVFPFAAAFNRVSSDKGSRIK